MNQKLFLLSLIGASCAVSAAVKKPAVKKPVKPSPIKCSSCTPAVKAAVKPAPKPVAKPAAPPLYQNDLEKLMAGKLPPEFLVLGGEFALVKDGANTVIELPGEPAEAFGLLFGPTIKEGGVSATARAFGIKIGRRAPAFAVGLSGISGYKARLSPAAGALEILRDEEVKTSQPVAWKSETWTWLKIAAKPLADGKWKVEAKAWMAGAAEPVKPLVEWTDTEAPPSGRASLLAAPYAGTPIRFDDLRVDKLGP